MGIADPQVCAYWKSIIEPRTVISVSSAVDKENIVVLDVSGIAGTKYLPIGVASKFPNVNVYYASFCGVTEITKENFAGMTKTRMITLDFNKITSISQGVFADLTSLERISLCKFYKKFSWYSNFSNPFLAGNPMKQLSANNIFEGLIVLRTVYFNGAGCVNTNVVNSLTPIVIPGGISHTCTLI